MASAFGVNLSTSDRMSGRVHHVSHGRATRPRGGEICGQLCALFSTHRIGILYIVRCGWTAYNDAIKFNGKYRVVVARVCTRTWKCTHIGTGCASKRTPETSDRERVTTASSDGSTHCKKYPRINREEDSQTASEISVRQSELRPKVPDSNGYRETRKKPSSRGVRLKRLWIVSLGKNRDGRNI